MKILVFITTLLITFVVQAAENIPVAVSEGKTESCVACHGKHGISTNAIWPNLAGQYASYLIKQLRDFKEGKTRDAATMKALVANLTPEDMVEIANFYAKQHLAEGTVPEKYLKRGEQLYRGGDYKQHITACIACHGPKGTGNQQAGFPILSGQNAPYLIQQLQAFKTHQRKNDLNEIMQDISMRMNQEDMEAVSYYIQGLH